MATAGAQGCGSRATHPPPPPPPFQQQRSASAAAAPATLIRIRSTPPVPLPRPFNDRASLHGLPDRISSSSVGDGVPIQGVDDGAPWTGLSRLQQPHSPTRASLDPVLNVEFFGLDAISKLDIVMSTLKNLFEEYSSQVNRSEADLEHEARYGEVNARDDTFDDWDQHRTVQLWAQSSNELSAYLSEATIPRVEEFDVLGWWKSNSATYPVLSRIACDVLSTPATTVPSESAFSTGERVVSDFQSRLNTDTVEALICLQDWMRAASPDKLVLQVVAPPIYKVVTNSDLSSDQTTYHSDLTSCLWA